MPTPPPLYRTKLPSGSPSSARLRKLAPSPVKVPPTPPLYKNTTPFFGADPSPRTQVPDCGKLISAGLDSGRGMKGGRSDRRYKGDDDLDPFEFDFAPLERTALITSPMEPAGKMYVHQRKREDPEAPSSVHTHSVRLMGVNASGAVSSTISRTARPRTAESTPPLRVTRKDSTDSNVSIPLLFDARGDFGVIAEKHRLAFSNVRRGQDDFASEDEIAGMRHDGGRGVEVDAPEELDNEWFQSSGDGASSLGLGHLTLSNSKINVQKLSSRRAGATGVSGVSEMTEVTEVTEVTGVKADQGAKVEEKDVVRNFLEDPLDRPVRVLVKFNNNIFGVDTRSSQPMIPNHSSGSLLAPSLASGVKTVLGDSFASSSSSFSAPDPMSFTRDHSLAESHYTFGKPHRDPTPISPTRPSTTDGVRRRDSIVAASVSEDDDGWSYTLSAYGDHEGDETELHTRSSSCQSKSDNVAVPFLSPHGGSTNSPVSAPSNTPTLFTPNYSIASPTTAWPQGVNDSPLPVIDATPLFASPPSPKTSLKRTARKEEPLVGKGSSMSVRSDLTMSASRATSDPPRRARGHTPETETSVISKSKVVENAKSGKSGTATTNDEEVKLKTESFPEMVREALHSVPKTTTVTLMIDQEGHREILTTMNHRTVQKPETYREREIKSLESAAMWCESPSRPEMFQQTGCVKFTGPNERKRPEWIFHHAALEHLPVLRRITVDQDEKHDYISRGATLQIRDVGVYAVYGSEDKGRVEWKFEYLVQESTSKSTGEIKPNEKKVIPLAFYASPTFFNPDRALKLNLLNVFKKQLTPNIVSEKVKPPRIGKPPPMTSLTDIEAAPTPTSTGSTNAVSRTFGAIAKAVGSRTGTPTTVESFGAKSSTEKKGRKRAATLFSRTKPDTPATTQNTPVPAIISSHPSTLKRAQMQDTPWLDSPSPAFSTNTEGIHKTLKPMKSLSALAVKQDKQRPSTAEPASYPGGRKGLVPMKSLSSLHRSATSIARPRTAESIPRVPVRSAEIGSREGFEVEEGRMTLRSSHPFASSARPATSTAMAHRPRLDVKIGFQAGHHLASKDVNIMSSAKSMEVWKSNTTNREMMDDPFARLKVPGDMERQVDLWKSGQPRSRVRGRPHTAEPAIRA